MNYTFKGQVKVADVQAAFDSLLGRINTIVTNYNTADDLTQNLDLSVGSPTLAAGGYTLSVGGIKKILEAYEGLLIGVRAFRIDSTHVAVTDGIYFPSESDPVRINAQVLEGDGFYIYFNPSDNSIGLVNNDTYPEGAVLILDLSASDDREYLNEYREVQLEGIPGYNISIQKRNMSGGIDADNTAINRFQGAGPGYIPKEGAGSVDFYDGTNRINVTRGWGYEGGMRRRHFSVCPASFLFIPKGCNTPLQVTNSSRMLRTQYTLEFNTQEEES